MDGDASTVRLSPSFDTRYNFALAFQCYQSEVNQHPVAYARCTEEWPVCLARGSCRGDEGLSIDKTALVSIDSDARTWAKHITRPIEAQKPHKNMDSRSLEISLVTRRLRKDPEVIWEPGDRNGSSVAIWEPEDSSLDPEIRFGTRRLYENLEVLEIIKQTNRAVYRLDPRTSGLELRPDPRPDAQTDRTEARLFRPTRQAKTDGQARTNLARANSDSDHGFSLLARLARTACTDDHADDLSTLFDPIMDFSFRYFPKARILKLSEDLGFVGTQLVRSERPVAVDDRPAYMLILTALDLAGSDASGRKPIGPFD
ncbi:hypothetical protein F2Q68_00030840 [Brassica cretica]|uniref:Uncharacterized protein n=1 Tax=Brassica cretica TaxID=69181 RepID=A0A8S9G841_BRACR|nr:hypothetical protein F2Q68_00030840 [Brassica cretica]